MYGASVGVAVDPIGVLVLHRDDEHVLYGRSIAGGVRLCAGGRARRDARVGPGLGLALDESWPGRRAAARDSERGGHHDRRERAPGPLRIRRQPMARLPL